MSTAVLLFATGYHIKRLLCDTTCGKNGKHVMLHPFVLRTEFNGKQEKFSVCFSQYAYFNVLKCGRLASASAKKATACVCPRR
jgi:hypothetical protein